MTKGAERAAEAALTAAGEVVPIQNITDECPVEKQSRSCCVIVQQRVTGNLFTVVKMNYLCVLCTLSAEKREWNLRGSTTYGKYLVPCNKSMADF